MFLPLAFVEQGSELTKQKYLWQWTWGLEKARQLLGKKIQIDTCGCVESALFNFFSQLLNAADCFACKVHMCSKCYDSLVSEGSSDCFEMQSS